MAPREIISPKTRTELREYFVGTSLGYIRDAFANAYIVPDESFSPPCGGARRTFVEQHYHTLDFAELSDVQKFLKLYAVEIEECDEATNSDFSRDWGVRLRSRIEKEGYEFRDGTLIARRGVQRLAQIRHAAGSLNLPELERQVHRLIEFAEDDPGLAIGTAKELVETVCKTVLQERGITVEANVEIPDLIKQVRKALDLLPESIPDKAKGAETIRVLLSNLGTIAQRLGELRNLYGTGHGRHGSTGGLAPRHARLAVGAAATLATFILETHEARGKGK